MRARAEDVLRLVVSLMRVGDSVQRTRSRENTGIFATLRVIAEHDQVRPIEIAAELGVHQSTITRQLRVLQDAEQVVLTADPQNRRSCFVALTERGHAESARLEELQLEQLAEFVDDWDTEDVRVLNRLLARYEDAAGESKEKRQGSPGRSWQQRT
jgi:DNA-binding MarR family transcriptional regulator